MKSTRGLTRTVLTLAAAAMALVVLTASAHGAVIFTEGFEGPDVPGPAERSDGWSGTGPTGWVKAGHPDYSGLADEGAGNFSTPHGAQAAWIYGNGSLTTSSAILNDTLKQDMDYTLTFNAGARSGGSNIEYIVELLAGAAVVGSASGLANTSDMSQSGTINLTTGAAHPNAGEALAVRLRKGTGAWQFNPLFDNISLDETAAGGGGALSPYTADANTLHLWHLDEANPGPALPASGVTGSFNLTPINGATLGNPSFTGFGTAADTSGDATRALQGSNIPVSNVTGADGAFTMEAIVNMSGTAGNNAIIMMDAAGGNSGRPLQFKIQDGDLVFLNIAPGLQSLRTALPTTGDDAFVPNEWFHAAVSYNGNESTADNLKLYWTALDPARTQANEIFSGNMTNDLAASAVLGVGNEFRDAPGENLSGLIDEVRISDVVRSPADFLFAPAGPPPPTPVAIDDLFNTGVDASGAPLPDGTIGDPHYTIASTPGGSTDIRVRTSAGGFPIGPWLGDNATSAWIGPNNAVDLSSPLGDYTFQTNFTLAGLADLSSVTISGAWASDNPGVDILLNGNSLLGSGDIAAAELSGGFTAYTAFDFGPDAPFFRLGTNTLGFVFNNSGVGPAGLRVDQLTGSYLLRPAGAPVPVTLPMVENWDFETNAGQFTAFPGYVGGSNPTDITGWPGPGTGGRGINPGNGAGAPFRNNGDNATNVAFIQNGGSISQSIDGWEPGKEYRVTFDYNARTGDDPGMTATIGSASMTDALIPEVGGSNAYYAANLVFTPTSDTNTLTIVSLDNAGDDTLLIDNIRVFRNGPSILDNGFEDAALLDNTWGQADGAGGGDLTGSAWTITGRAGITRNRSPFQNGGIFAPEGEQHALIQEAGEFLQRISGFEVGAEYSFSLLTMARQGQVGGNDLEVLLDAGLPTEIPLIDIAEVIFSSFTEQESASFLAQKDSYELTIRSSLDGGLLTGDRTTFFDALWFNQLTEAGYIPEPATLSLLGLGLLAVRRRRRR
ncbi:PEP-CTERM sorting domain-containing protein [bacterium]|nr:PEP-CTERM sorting domain-containing protein [bacterium]